MACRSGDAMTGKQNMPGAGGGLVAHSGDIIAQAIVIGCVGGIALLLTSSLIGNLEARSIRTGFGFLWQGANFEIGQSLIPFTASDSYGMALLAGLLNTICVAALAIVFSTLLGLLIGFAGLSRNPSVSLLARGYVELVRNVPLLLQLYFLYSIFTQMLPAATNALTPFPGIFLDRSGLHFPLYEGMAANGFLWLSTGVAASLLFRRATRNSDMSFRGLVSLFLAFGPALLAFAYTAATSSADVPQQTRFGFNGGGTLPPELTALLLGLSIYNAAFIAEILRGGIKSVSSGQVEAGSSSASP
jgi:general L-amino acid transport system permease protein